MFTERGFDAVRVAEVAEACGVSEKTVFNYFPTKESLVLDRLEATMESLRTGLADPGVPPVEAALRILDRELAGLTALLAGQDQRNRTHSAFGTRTSPTCRDMRRTAPRLTATTRTLRPARPCAIERGRSGSAAPLAEQARAAACTGP
jgi:AcrR family transcriptional regulator